MLLTFLLFTLFLKIVFVLSTFLLSKYLLKNEKLALLATFMLSFTHFMGPEEIGVTQVLAKNLIFAFMPLLFYLFFKYYKKTSVVIFIVLGFFLFFHSITVLPIILLFLYSLLFEKKNFKLFSLCLLVSLIFSFFYFKSTSIYQEQFDVSTLNLRAMLPPYIYYSVLKFGLVIVPGFFIIRKNNKELFNWLLLLSVYSAISIFSLFSDKVTLMQFFRSAKYIIYFSFIYSTILVSWLWNRSKLTAIFFAFLIFFPFSNIFYSTAFEDITKPKNTYLYYNNEVIYLGDWLDKNTPHNSVLLAPPDWIEIKIWSKRSTVALWYDAGWCQYSKTLSAMCKERKDDVTKVYNQTSTEEFLKIARKYDANYIITFNSSLNLKEEKTVGKFKVYKVLP